MPEAVGSFSERHDYERVRRIHLEILAGYERDMSKHVPGRGVERVLAVWNSIPQHLAQENRRFVFGHVRQALAPKTMPKPLPG